LELAPGIIIIKDVVGRVFFIDPFAIAAFYCVNAIVFTIKKCVNVADENSPFVAGKPCFVLLM